MPFTELAGLAAARAALDPERASWRNDILLSSVVEVLASRGPMSERELLLQIQSLWVSTTVDRNMLRRSLEQAEAANLVESRHQGRGEPRWAVTESCAADARMDRQWATDAIATFENQVRARLRELVESEIDEQRAVRITNTLIGALIAGSHGIFRGVAEIGHSALTSISFDKSRADAHIADRINPPEVANAVSAMAVSALDPADNFGSEIVKLVVAGQVLHGLLTHRDVGTRNLHAGTLLLLDTSALFYLLDDQRAQSQLLKELVKDAVADGCDVAVTRSVLREWDRVWEAAAAEHAKLSDDSSKPPPLAGRFADNVAVRAWFMADEFGDGPNWSEFIRKHRDIERWIKAAGVRVIEDGQADPELVARYEDELQALSDAAPRQMRTRAAAETDAYSAAIVHEQRQRRQGVVPQAWFIAQERLTSEAYKNVRTDDRYPLVMSVEGALLLLAATRIDDPAARRQLAEVVGDSVILNSFFAISAGYTLDDILTIVDLLGRDVRLQDQEDAEESIRADLLALASASPDPPADLLRRRALRRDRQARRRAAEVVAREAEAERQVTAASDRVRSAEADTAGARRENLRLRRVIKLVIVLAVMVLGIIVVGVLGAPTVVIVVAAAATLALAAEGVGWINDARVTTTLFVASVVAAGAWTVVGTVLGIALTDNNHSGTPGGPASTRPHPSTSTPVPSSPPGTKH